ncbi:DUF6082 family protein [Phytohabitans rumicis]|uniref:Uncharacterized protein n=1 Tax=Phytohabitans rumicis TaxID=1076125 RepID=A0A6V8L9S1_9ACTN|nr:DUF6082 family protein [Phytohabitans rumicis]GFJ90787.1 hypothetical protein Prum_044290 [Phytohabitans rumicis]
MTIRKLDLAPEVGGNIKKIATAAIAVAASVAISMGFLLSPMLVGSLNRSNQDWSRLSEIGEAYGPVSALLATLALVAVSVSLLLQRSQLRHDRLWLQREMTFNLLKVAMDDPAYGQCWGPRVSPPEVDERFFYYVNLILMVWSHTWENQQVSEDQIRTYARTLFDSEVPRLYWQRFGGLRSNARPQERSFYRIINDEYVKAVTAGPPSRPFEPPSEHQRRNHAPFVREVHWPANASPQPAPRAGQLAAPPEHQP